MIRRLRPAALAAFALGALFLTTPAHADTLLQTSTLGATGQGNIGPGITNVQYLGARFQTADTFTLTDVQIHMRLSVSGNGILFAAIVPLSSMSAFPNAGDPTLIADDNPVETQTFTGTTSSSVVTIPFSSVLPAGTYAVVFGSNEFGASGVGTATDNNSDIGTPSYFFRNNTTFQNGGFANVYFVVNGSAAAAAPEPGALVLLAIGVAPMAGVLLRARRR